MNAPYEGAAARDRRLAPVPLPDGGLYVPAPLTAELAGALELLRAFIAGTPPPVVCRAPRMSRVAIAVLQASSEAAVLHQRYQSQPQGPFAAASAPPAAVLTPAKADGSSPQEITSGAAAAIAGLSEARIRQLATAGTIQGRKVGRNTWLLNPVSVRAYAARPRTRSSTRAGHHDDAEREARPGAA